MDVTRGAINQLVRMPDKQRDPGSVKPVLQVLKIIPVGSQQQRYRVSAYYKQSFVFQFTGKSLFTISLFSSLCTQVILSDGVNHAQGMLATTHNDRCINGDLIENSLIRINECISNWIQEKNVIIVINFDIVNTHYGQKIGTPVDLGLKKSDILASAPPQANNMGHIRPSGNYNSNPSVSTQNAYGNVRGGGGSNPYNSAPIVHSNNSHDARYTPIAGLNMYQNRWTIKARVTKKDDVCSSQAPGPRGIQATGQGSRGGRQCRGAIAPRQKNSRRCSARTSRCRSSPRPTLRGKGGSGGQTCRSP